MTFAFGMNNTFKEVYEQGNASLRMALMDKLIRGMKHGPKRDAELKRMENLRKKPQNILAIGDFIRSDSAIDGWVKEKLSGLNFHVNYVHDKFMLIDPLGEDPIVVAGSANFSDASIRKNDENMVITRGNKRVADIYLGEFMRLYSHHAFREWAKKWYKPGGPLPAPKVLRVDDWWKSYFGDTSRSTRRKFFV